jgi:acetylornithine deacetylase
MGAQTSSGEAHVQLLADLVSIESVNPDLVPGGAGEGEIANYIAGWLERAGLDVELSEAAPRRPNVIGVARGEGGGRSLMLNAHMDTVGCAGMRDPFVPRIENGKLYGRGAYDMKGSLAAILLAAAAAHRLKLKGDVIVTAVCDEEYASIGTSALLKQWRADAAIVTEPTGLDLCIAHKGFVWFEIISHGAAAHGSRPDLGVDAIAKMGRVLVGLEQLNEQLRQNQAHPLVGAGSLHASLISGGQELSSYPARCALSIERRTVPGERVGDAEAQIRRIITEAAAGDSSATFTLKRGLAREPFEIAGDAVIVQLLRRHVRGVTGREPRLYGDTPWMDAALTSLAGIPTVVFGPGGGGAHADVEWSNLDEVRTAADILARAAAEFCG